MSTPKNDKVLALLGIAMRAGAIIDGESRVLQTLSKHRGSLVFLARDAGANITKKIYDKCHNTHATLNHDYNAETLSHAVGKHQRTVIATIDQRFIKPLKTALSQPERGDF